MRAWAPTPPTGLPLDDETTDRLIAHLAADGLWLYDTITGTPLPADVRTYLSERIAALSDTHRLHGHQEEPRASDEVQE